VRAVVTSASTRPPGLPGYVLWWSTRPGFPRSQTLMAFARCIVAVGGVGGRLLLRHGQCQRIWSAFVSTVLPTIMSRLTVGFRRAAVPVAVRAIGHAIARWVPLLSRVPSGVVRRRAWGGAAARSVATFPLVGGGRAVTIPRRLALPPLDGRPLCRAAVRPALGRRSRPLMLTFCLLRLLLRRPWPVDMLRTSFGALSTYRRQARRLCHLLLAPTKGYGAVFVDASLRLIGRPSRSLSSRALRRSRRLRRRFPWPWSLWLVELGRR
jgi:hypothetical protein